MTNAKIKEHMAHLAVGNPERYGLDNPDDADIDRLVFDTCDNFSMELYRGDRIPKRAYDLAWEVIVSYFGMIEAHGGN